MSEKDAGRTAHKLKLAFMSDHLMAFRWLIYGMIGAVIMGPFGLAAWGFIVGFTAPLILLGLRMQYRLTQLRKRAIERKGWLDD